MDKIYSKIILDLRHERYFQDQVYSTPFLTTSEYALKIIFDTTLKEHDYSLNLNIKITTELATEKIQQLSLLFNRVLKRNDVIIHSYEDYKSVKQEVLNLENQAFIASQKWIWHKITRMILFSEVSLKDPFALFQTCKLFYSIGEKDGWYSWDKITEDKKIPERQKYLMSRWKQGYPEMNSASLALRWLYFLGFVDQSIMVKNVTNAIASCCLENRYEEVKAANTIIPLLIQYSGLKCENLTSIKKIEILKNKFKNTECFKINKPGVFLPKILFNIFSNVSEIEIKNLKFVCIKSKDLENLKNLKKITISEADYLELEIPKNIEINLKADKIFRLKLDEKIETWKWSGDCHRVAFDFLNSQGYEAKTPMAKLAEAIIKHRLEGKDLLSFIKKIKSSYRQGLYKKIYDYSYIYLNKILFIPAILEDNGQRAWGKKYIFVVPQPILDMAIDKLMRDFLDSKELISKEHLYSVTARIDRAERN